MKLFLLGFFENESVDVVARPRTVTHRRHGGLDRQLISPEFPTFLDTHSGLLPREDRINARIGSADLHPMFEIGHLLGIEALFRRHLKVRVMVANGLEAEALLRIARDQRRAGITAFGPAFAGVESQTALLLLPGT